MVEWVHNVVKRDCKKAKRSLPEQSNDTEPKRKKKGNELLRRYPVNCSTDLVVQENPESLQQHKKAFAAELKKAKPRDSVLLPLLKSTYSEWRMFILDVATSVATILEEYTSLSRPAVVSVLIKFALSIFKSCLSIYMQIEQEMSLIFGGKSTIKFDFIKQWQSRYVPAILLYAEKSTKKNITSLLTDLDEAGKYNDFREFKCS